jgi:hypothetical protein
VGEVKVDLPEVVFGWNYGVQQEHSVLEMTALHEVQKSVIKTDTLDGPSLRFRIIAYLAAA